MAMNFLPFLFLSLDIQASLMAQLVKNPPAIQETRFGSWVRKILWRRDRLPTPVFLGFPCGSAGRKSTCNAGDLGSIPGLGRSPGEGKGHPLQYSGLEKSMDYTVHAVAKSRTRPSDFYHHHQTSKTWKWKGLVYCKQESNSSIKLYLLTVYLVR